MRKGRNVLVIIVTTINVIIVAAVPVSQSSAPIIGQHHLEVGVDAGGVIGGGQERKHGLKAGAQHDDVELSAATIRKCQEGYKIGPLFALAPEPARSLFNACCAVAEPGAQVIIDVPESNTISIAMAQDHGLEPVFETARMYRGEAPKLPLSEIYGVTTFELG